MKDVLSGKGMNYTIYLSVFVRRIDASLIMVKLSILQRLRLGNERFKFHISYTDTCDEDACFTHYTAQDKIGRAHV